MNNINEIHFDNKNSNAVDGQTSPVKKDDSLNENFNTVVEEDFDDGDERVSVPLTVSMLIMTAYLGLGAVTFDQFEGWGIITSAYFCFVTVATIGKLCATYY